MDDLAPYAADEQMRVEALYVAGIINRDGSQNTVISDAESFLSFLLGDNQRPV